MSNLSRSRCVIQVQAAGKRTKVRPRTSPVMPWPFSQVRTVSPVCHRSSIRSEGNALQVPKSEDQRPTQTRLPFCRPYPPPSGRAIGVQIPLVTVMILPLGKVANLACTLMSAAHASSASITALSNRTGKARFVFLCVLVRMRIRPLS